MRLTISLPVCLAASLAGVSFALLIYDILSLTVSSPVETRPALPEPTPILAVATPPPEADPLAYTTMAARPLFFPSRRLPAAPVSTASAPTLPSLDFVLVGVVDAPGAKLALVKRPGQQAADLVHIGSIIDGWTVAKINVASIDVHVGTTSTNVKIVQ